MEKEKTPQSLEGHEACPSMEPPSDAVPSFEVSPYDDDGSSIDVKLERYNAYILSKAKLKANALAKVVHRDTLDLDIEDVAQDVLVGFWQQLREEKRIHQPEAYLTRMVHNKCIDFIRKGKRRTSPQLLSQLLSMADNEDALEDKFLVKPSESMGDPADEFEQQQAVADVYLRTAQAVSELPPRQQLAMTCHLLHQAHNLVLLVKALKACGVNTDVDWPEDEHNKHLLKACLSAARLAVAKHLNVDLSLYKGKKQRSSQLSSPPVKP